METRHPNRERGQNSGSEETRRKQSGDQHLDPPNEADQPAGQPHRTNRDTRHGNSGKDTPTNRSGSQ
jgi:hypothetical protein